MRKSKKSTAEKKDTEHEEDTIPEEFIESKKRGPDGSWGWFVVFNSFVCNMIVDGMQYTFGNFLVPITVSLDSTVTTVSLIGSLLSGFYNFSGPVAGAIGNKFGFRMVAIAGSIVSSAGLMVSYFSPSIYFLYFSYGILGGLGFGMIYMASVITTSVYFDKYRALAVSISVCGTGVGTFVFAPMGNLLVTHYGWRWALVMEGGIILVCILCGLSFKSVEMFKMVPMSSEDSDMALSLDRSSFYYNTERRKTLPNEAYPTLKEAMIYQDERRSTTISLVPKSQRASAIEFPNPSRSDFVWHPSYDTHQTLNTGNKCQNLCRICCFNFWHCSFGKKDLSLGDRPMYRDDVFYGSNLSQLKFTPSERLKYHMSVTRMPDPREVQEHMSRKCCVCHHAFLRTCATMTGFHLLKSKIFAFLCVSSFMYTMGLYIPYVFIKELGIQCQIPEDTAVWLVSAIGISNTAGRLVSGIVKSLLNVNSALFVLGCLCISGIFSFIFLFCQSLECLMSFSCVFGFFTAPFISLRPVIIVDFLGLEKLTNAFGLVLLCQGIASIIGPPIAGIVVGSTGNYDNIMYLSGSLMLISATALLTSTLFHMRKHR